MLVDIATLSTLLDGWQLGCVLDLTVELVVTVVVWLMWSGWANCLNKIKTTNTRWMMNCARGTAGQRRTGRLLWETLESQPKQCCKLKPTWLEPKWLRIVI
eukprot:129432-Amphidinium_carterae.1